MTTLRDTYRWITDPAHWTGTEGIPYRLLEHVTISAAALLIACALALPVAITLGHLGRGGGFAVNVSNIGRAVPTFAVLVLLAASPVGFGNRATVVALTIFAIPPILMNAYVGMRSVDAEARESAVGMGMSRGQLLRRVEVPLAAPLIATGIRTAAVQVVATATLAAVVGGGGLGRFIVDGFGRADDAMLLTGALLVALLAVAIEVALGSVERRLSANRGDRSADRKLPAVAPAPL
ncbi:MAG: ABC transporter permease [Actinomycetota bacterium]|nr:ABC transporter permease [Actinomycetota bacterium]